MGETGATVINSTSIFLNSSDVGVGLPALKTLMAYKAFAVSLCSQSLLY